MIIKVHVSFSMHRAYKWILVVLNTAELSTFSLSAISSAVISTLLFNKLQIKSLSMPESRPQRILSFRLKSSFRNQQKHFLTIKRMRARTK